VLEEEEEELINNTVLLLNVTARYCAPLLPNSLYFKSNILNVYDSEKNMSRKKNEESIKDYFIINQSFSYIFNSLIVDFLTI
jgi:hypothetical protein